MSQVRRTSEPVDLSGLSYIPVDSLHVMEFYEGPGGEGEPTQVHLQIRVEGLDLPLVFRFKGHQTISHLIEALTVHRNNVWPGVRRPGA